MVRTSHRSPAPRDHRRDRARGGAGRRSRRRAGRSGAAVLIVLAAGCGSARPPVEPAGSGPAPAALAPAPGPEAAEPEVAPAAEPEAAREDRRAAPPHPESRAVLALVGGQLVPLACHDGAAGELGSAEDCFELVPVGSTAVVDGEPLPAGCRPRGREQVVLTGRSEAICVDEGPRSLTTTLETTDGCRLTGFALWPVSAAELAVRLAHPSEDLAGPPLSPRLRAAVERTVRREAASSSAGLLTFRQHVVLDGAGRRPRRHLISVHLARQGASPEGGYPPVHDPTADEELAPFLLSALVLADDGGRVVRVLERSEWSRFSVLATIDLERDGDPELLYEWEYYEGSGLALAHLEETGLTRIGQWACGV